LFPDSRRYECGNCGKTSFFRSTPAYSSKTPPASTNQDEAPASINTQKASAEHLARANGTNQSDAEKMFIDNLGGYLSTSSNSIYPNIANDNPIGNMPLNISTLETLTKTASTQPSTITSTPEQVHQQLRFPGHFTHYQNTTTVEEEIVEAKRIHKDLRESISWSIDDFHKSKQLKLGLIRASTHKLVESMIRNPDSAFLLSKLKDNDDFVYSHPVSTSILAVLFGRYMGLSRRELHTLALATLFLDIGKIQLPRQLLEKRKKLVLGEVALLQKHVAYSLDILDTTDITNDVFVAVENHHERIDGKGYPHHKQDEEIPLFAKIATIADAYDAITHPRPYRNALSPSSAISALGKQRGLQFQEVLLDQFFHCLGAFPTGSMVILNTGEAGMVIAQNQTNRSQPKVLIFRDNNKGKVISPFMRDLEAEALNTNGNPIHIKVA
jgi:HD-GYP domain-containing protein (c-di-GMP phosphodiesterase class II)